jgi:hypothetical protein
MMALQLETRYDGLPLSTLPVLLKVYRLPEVYP